MKMTQKNPIGFLSGNLLKILAMVAMSIDHFAVLFHPYDLNWRIVGRIAFPIFAFFLAEGFRYTKNRLRYFLTLAVAGVLFQVVYYCFTHGEMRNIFITLALALLPLFPLEATKKALVDKEASLLKKVLFPTVLCLTVYALFLFCEYYKPDYGFPGVMLATFASLAHAPRGVERSDFFQKVDILPVSLFGLFAGLLFLNHTYGGIQHYSLLSLLPLTFYSGERGRWKMKYFFYIYYPVHLVALEGLYLLL